MPCKIYLVMLGALLYACWAAETPRLTCEEFSRNATFSASQAIGLWYIVYLPPTNHQRCVKFETIDEQERNGLKASISKYVKDLKWENLLLKMQLPCAEEDPMKAAYYFLEKMDVIGKYKTLELPLVIKTKLVPTDFKREEMRIKIVEGKYLAAMFCEEDFTFLLDKRPHKQTLEPNLMKFLQTYMPDYNL